MEYYIGAWKKYADFTGRARRKEFWMFFLFNLIVSIGMNLVDMALGSMLVGTLYSLAVFLPSLAIGARRLHDTGRSGWWQLIALIPIIGIIILIVFYCQDSQDENDYGENPKAFA
ncbi:MULTISPECIES: DUF805 domain-containing protein [Shewanella]|uniref:DUF805 domain-containing protein n=1 Tax=Shewanella TaxID=22 RepID=UPI001C659527|nr:MULTISPECIES: DUF805 domain-containing protein [Shewanella]QYJ74422.1 DUF805 domain-containing protein [Shewanella sp. FJAT-52076]QYK04294.1 DUF805 domain-containing protein [Shewanella zhangzhouensis]